jgi:hypothetical protein
MNNKKATDFILKAVLLSIAIIPLIYYYQIKEVPIKIFILGTGSWGIGVILKMIFHQLIIVPLQSKRKSTFLISVVNGILSGITELFAAFFIITLMKNKIEFDFNAIISFGLAIGSLEILIVVFSKNKNLFKGTSLEDSSKKTIEYFKKSTGIEYFIINFLLAIYERILALLLHISTRGLVFITIFTGSVLPIGIALLVFTIADGPLAFYYHVTGKLTTLKSVTELIFYFTVLTALSVFVFYSMYNPIKHLVL